MNYRANQTFIYKASDIELFGKILAVHKEDSSLIIKWLKNVNDDEYGNHLINQEFKYPIIIFEDWIKLGYVYSFKNKDNNIVCRNK